MNIQKQVDELRERTRQIKLKPGGFKRLIAYGAPCSSWLTIFMGGSYPNSGKLIDLELALERMEADRP